MTFDPEKVERTRWANYGYEGYSPWPEDGTNDMPVGNYPEDLKITVLASDYDALLALYRNQRGQIAILRECETHRKELILERRCDDGGTR